MALGATVHRIELELADIDRSVYGTHALTLARHPSETEERLMLRLLAWALFADPALEFGRGLSAEEEPDLWLRELDGALRQWIELGLPEEKRLRRAAGRASEVIVIAYGGRSVPPWWDRQRAGLERIAGLGRLVAIDDDVDLACALPNDPKRAARAVAGAASARRDVGPPGHRPDRVAGRPADERLLGGLGGHRSAGGRARDDHDALGGHLRDLVSGALPRPQSGRARGPRDQRSAPFVCSAIQSGSRRKPGNSRWQASMSTCQPGAV